MGEGGRDGSIYKAEESAEGLKCCRNFGISKRLYLFALSKAVTLSVKGVRRQLLGRAMQLLQYRRTTRDSPLSL